MENRVLPIKKLKVEEPSGCFFHGSPGSPHDYHQLLQFLQEFRTSAPQRDFLNIKNVAESYVRFDFYVAYSYGCRVLIDILHEMVAKNLASHETLKKKRVFLIAPFLVGESKTLTKLMLNLPLLGSLLLSFKKEKIARAYANKIALPSEPASRLLESVETYTEMHFKNAVFEKKDFPPSLNVLSNFKTFCLIPENDTTIDTKSVSQMFSKYGKIENLLGATHSCLWTHSHPIAQWIKNEYIAK